MQCNPNMGVMHCPQGTNCQDKSLINRNKAVTGN